MRLPTLALTLGATALLSSACVFVDAQDTGSGHGNKTSTSQTSQKVARATVEGKSGSSLSGHATFKEVRGGVLVEISVENAPTGWHAVHVHENGDCSADDGTSAGGHFNPGGVAHGSPHAAEHHAGDLGNMWVNEKGLGRHVILMPELSVDGGSNAVRGRAMIVHAGADDLVTQPTGAAGGRIGCGVIR